MTVLNLRPTSAKMIRSFTTIRTPKDAPANLRRERFPGVHPRAWEMGYEQLSLEQMQHLESVWEETAGGAGVFQWTPPREVTQIDARFLGGSLAIEARSPRRYDARVTILPARPQD